MNDDLETATEKLNEAYAEVREDLGRVYVAFDDLRAAGPTDDLSHLLKVLEGVVHDVRTGGLMGSGANKHKRAREKWIAVSES